LLLVVVIFYIALMLLRWAD